MKICVCIPHFFKEKEWEKTKKGYGSSRKGNKENREKAIIRALEGLIAMRRSSNDYVLNIAKNIIQVTPQASARIQDVELNINIFKQNENICSKVFKEYETEMQIHEANIENPKEIPIATINYMLNITSGADYYIYMEDDIVITDNNFLEKISWFYSKTENNFVLMPHRYERTSANKPKKLYVDGPIKTNTYFKTDTINNEKEIAKGNFDGKHITFVEAANPHSGMLIISKEQMSKIKKAWPPDNFISALETAATGTVLNVFPIVKTSWKMRREFEVEHANPSFLEYLNKWA